MKNNLAQPLPEDFSKDDDLRVRLRVDGEEHEIPAVVTDLTTLTQVPLECVPVNWALPCPLFAPVGDRYVMLRRHGDQISPARLQSLAHAGASSLFIPKVFWKLFIDAVEQRKQPEADTEERVRNMRALLLAYAEEIETKLAPPKRQVFDRLEKLVGQLAEEIVQNPASGIRHLRRNHDPLLYSANHAVNSAIYATLIGMALKYPQAKLKLLAFACLVHDIGNLFIPREILQKKGALTPEEFAQMRTHTLQGAELLQSVGAPPEVVQTAYQHHERVDGKGYPQALPGPEIHPFAKICAIADVFDAITSNRPHQAGLSGDEAMRRMRQQEGLFDPEFLSKLAVDKIR